MPKQDTSSPVAFEQSARQQVPRMLIEWLGLRESQPTVIIYPRSEVEGVDLSIVLEQFLFLVEARKTNAAPSVHSAAELVKKYASLQRDEGNTKQCVIPLVVVPFMTDSGKEICEKAGVSWLDLSGNAYMQSRCPENRVFVHVEGKPNRFPRRGRPKNPFDGKAARIARHLLLHPGTSWSQIDLAKATNVDPGYTSRVVRRLIDLDLLTRDDDKVQNVRWDFLLRAWREANSFKHSVVEGHVPARSGEELVHRLAELFQATDTKHAVTGLAAAWAYTHAASFRSASIYVGGSPREQLPFDELSEIGFRRETRAPNTRLLIPDDAGVFDGIRLEEGFWCVSVPQVFVDLEHEGERAEEFSEAIYSLAIEQFERRGDDRA
ncbi:MAG TPA: hypothetical protein VMO47_06330 [Rhodothermales bacterium]|nr:hypothetical protein [Rhodothermales bacterium]